MLDQASFYKDLKVRVYRYKCDGDTVGILTNGRVCARSCCYCLGIATKAQLLKGFTWLPHLLDNKAPPAAHDEIEVPRSLIRLCSHQRITRRGAQLLFKL